MLTLLAAIALAAPQPGALRTHRDWTVGCDNGRACQAVALLPENGKGATLAIERGPGANAMPLIWVTVRDEGVESPEWLEIDGKRFTLSLDRSTQALRVRDGAGAAALLGQATRIAALGRGGRTLASVSTRGSAAALLYMDEQQRRVGTTGALVRRGPMVAVPAPLALPVVREVRPTRRAPAPRIAAPRVAKLRQGGGCDPDLTPTAYGQESHRLDDRTSVVLLRCWQGPYNGTSLVLISRARDGGDARPAVFDYEATAGERRGFDVPPDGAYWDAESGRLASYFKGRGLGDCGTTQEWAWDGNRFRLIEQTAMGECRGSTDYITTWRARVVAR